MGTTGLAHCLDTTLTAPPQLPSFFLNDDKKSRDLLPPEAVDRVFAKQSDARCMYSHCKINVRF